jgi:hypothetical protein
MWCPCCKSRNVTTLWTYISVNDLHVNVPIRICLSCGDRHKDAEACYIIKRALQGLYGETEIDRVHFSQSEASWKQEDSFIEACCDKALIAAEKMG